MADDVRFSISEEACTDLENFFGEAVTEAVDRILEVFADLCDINDRAKYELVIKNTNEAAEYYSGEFVQDVLSLYDTWCEEGESLHRFLLDVEAAEDDGDESAVAAQELEAQMRDRLEEALSQQPELYTGSTRAQLTEYGGKETLFEDIDELLDKFIGEMEDQIDEVKSTEEQESDENQLYENVGGILGSILEACKGLFEIFREGMRDNVSEHVSEKADEAMGKVESDKETLQGQAQSIGEKLKDIAAMFHF